MGAIHDVSHVVLRDGFYICLNCGANLRPTVPADADDFLQEATAFIREHAICPKGANPMSQQGHIPGEIPPHERNPPRGGSAVQKPKPDPLPIQYTEVHHYYHTEGETRQRMSGRYEHLVFTEDNCYHCEHCGIKEKRAVPQQLWLILLGADQFTERHRYCKKETE